MPSFGKTGRRGLVYPVLLCCLFSGFNLIIYYILDTVSGTEHTEKIKRHLLTLKSLDSCDIEIVLNEISKICMRTATYQAVFLCHACTWTFKGLSL